VTVIVDQNTALSQDLETTRATGTIREKIRFPDNGDRLSYARYFVCLTDRPDEQAVVDADHIVRDRKTFTKQILRSYLRNALHRESWAGAPWRVKEQLARKFRIPTEVPIQLQHEFQAAHRRHLATIKKGASEHEGTIMNIPSHGRLLELKPKGQKGKMSRSREQQFLEYQRVLASDPSLAFGQNGPGPHDPNFGSFMSQHHQEFQPLAPKGQPKLPPAAPIKYPIEDLEIPPCHDNRRPALKFLSEETTNRTRISEGAGNGIDMDSVGELLETWNTLNVYCEVYLLDSFTFDDYVQALLFTSEEVQCELVNEIHCALLKQLVNDEKDLNGQVHINLPEEDHDGSDEESSTSKSTSKTPTPEPEIKPRTTRSSLAKSEAAELKAAAEAELKIHQASETDQCVRGYGWKQRLRKRDLGNGRWIVIIVGLLNLFSSTPRLQKRCEQILAQLAPVNMEPTEETAILQYSKLNINLRVKVVKLLCDLSMETAAFRGYMDDCTKSMTEYRKDKIDWQRDRKAACVFPIHFPITLLTRYRLEDLKNLDIERRSLQPEAALPVIELEALEELNNMEELEEELENVKRNDQEGDEDTVMASTSGTEEDPVPQRSLRRDNDRAAARNKKREEDRKRKEKAEAEKAKKPTKEARQLEKINKKIDDLRDRIKECENEIAICDNDLRESDCHRTRVLGKDRFWNRYYWFERNAMPYAGLPTSSTADAGYANGCIWVQGPDDVEREGFIEMNTADNERYIHHFGMTVPNRKMMEEGLTHTFYASQWAYYDDPDDVDRLIGWLDAKGVREIKLRKELEAQRGRISECMVNRKNYLSKASESRSESAEPVTRVSTRTKTYVDPSGYRCLRWKNTTALEKLNHLHSEQPKAPKKGVAKPLSKKEKAAAAAAAEDEGRQTRASNRTGKTIGRQGTRYNF
jgi:hypothetical protein